MKMFKKFGLIAFLSFMAFATTSCLIRFWDYSEYPDDGIAEEDRRDITLTFNLNGGTISTPLVNGTLTAKEGKRLSIPNPTKEGYIFTGWTPTLPSRVPSENTTYTATFNRTKEYSINYNLNGGTNHYANPYSYNIKSSTITLQPATRQGYTFDGWYVDSSYRTRITQIPSGSTGNVNLYPKWIPGMSAYRIEHWLQNANDNNYTISPNDTETRTALSDSTTTASPKYFNGFTALNITQQKVAGDGSTVVKVMYNRNLVEFYFNLDGGTGTTILKGKYGENVIAPSVPTKAGYAFAGWSPSLPATFTTNATYKAMWRVSADPTYKVEHWQQNVYDNGYSLFATTTETTISSTGGNAGTAVKNYPGFTVQSIDQAKVSSDGSAVVKIYYTRNTVELTLDLDGGSGTRTLRGKYGAAISMPANPTKNGYNFAGWSPALPATFPANNTTYRALWSTSAVSYKVEHYQQNANDNGYTIVASDTETKTGTVGTYTAASAKSYNGFAVQGVSQLAIAANGSTVVKIYYNRNVVELTLDLDGGSGTRTLRGKYGATVSMPANPTKNGYNFAGWSPALPTTFPEYSSTYRALWTTSAASYRVEHYQQNANDYNYTIVPNATETKAGTAGTATTAAARIFQGFTAQEFNQATIAADGSTVVKIYYDRNMVELTFDLDGGAGMSNIKGAYGSKITAISTPKKSGYTFAGWSPALPTTFPENNATFKALWTTTTVNYKVEHYQQNANDNGYTLVQTANETKTGTAGTITSAAARTYTGFSAQGVTQLTIAADGSTVVKIYYNRNTVELTLNLDGGSGETSLRGKFGANVGSPATPTKNGYKFVGWSPALPSTFPYQNATYTALWEKVNTTMGYKVEHWQQNPDDDEYTIVVKDTETKSGDAGTTTNAIAKNYNGFWSKWFQQETIAADGSTVIRIYYDRNAADLNLDLDGGTGINLIKGRYGAMVYAPPAPTKPGYTFGGWYPPLPAKFPATSQVHKAIWNAN